MKPQSSRLVRALYIFLSALAATALLAGCGTAIFSAAASRTPPPAGPQGENPPASAATEMQSKLPVQAGPDTTPPGPSEPAGAGQAQQGALPCAQGCPPMGITQAGRVSRVDWTDQGAQAAAQAGLLPEAQSANGRWLVDTGTASPDGAWVAYTSISYENGGPIFLQETTTGAWSNLTEAMNRARPQDSPALPQTYGWDVIGWFPDSRRLLVGPVDLSIVFVVERESGAFQAIPFDGGGRGGRAFVHLAPDGTRFLFVADDASGAQVLNFYDLASGTVTPVATLSYEEGFLANPRFAPDSSGVAYVVQRGAPGGAADTLELMPLDGGPARTLAKGSLWMAVPIWSPDAQTLAFARAAPSPAAAVPAAENQTQAVLPEMVQSDIWVVTVADGLLSQVTMADGIERSPVWSPDSSSLAYVTGLGEVQMVSLADPSAVAQVTGPAPEAPELTSMFFLP